MNTTFTIREATVADIPQIQYVRNAVKENVLSDPALVSDADCQIFMTQRGKGWVCEMQQAIIGFAIADLRDNNIWALFVHPDFEKMGVGSRLHDIMLDWYFSTGKENVWLATDPASRAFVFYQRKGWIHAGLHGKKEAKFTMDRQQWRKQSVYGKLLT